MMRLLFIFLIVIAGLLVLSVPTHALTVAPALTEVELDPGSSVEREVTVFNETSAPITVSARVESFVPKGEYGATEVVTDSNQALRWVQLGQNLVTVAPGTAQTIPVLITVPNTATVGGYYVAIMWQQSSSDTTGVAINSRVGSLLLLTVKGEAKRSLAIKDVVITNSGISLPLQVTVSVENTGNVHLKPSGLIIIKNIFNRVVATVPLNTGGGNVLPQSTRIFDALWPSEKLTFIDSVRRLGLVRASIYVEVAYDDVKITSDEQKIWTVSPLAVATFFMLLGLIICCGGALVIRKNKQPQT